MPFEVFTILIAAGNLLVWFWKIELRRAAQRERGEKEETLKKAPADVCVCVQDSEGERERER